MQSTDSSNNTNEPACESCRRKDQQIARLKDELQVAVQCSEQLREQLNETLEELARTREVLANCQRALYGPSSERIVDDDSSDSSGSSDSSSDRQGDASQGDEKADASQGADDAQNNSDQTSEKKKPRKRTNHGWGKLPDDLERRPETHDVPEEERVCPECGGEMVRIGEDETERVEIDPPKVFARQIVRPKYVCPNCKGAGVKQAPAPPSPRPSSRFDFQFVTHVTVSKFADHLPIYRQQDILARLGLEIPRSTLDGVLTTAERLLEPLVEHMIKRLLATDLIGVDDTPVAMRRQKTCDDEKAPSGYQTARMWIYRGFDEAPYDVFDFCLNREHKGPAAFLENFQGYVKADAFGVEDGVYLNTDGRIIASGCWAHARRKFVESRGGGRRLADIAIATIRELYILEDAAKHLSPEARKAARQEHAKPILDRLYAWAKEEHPRQLPKRLITGALGYLLNQWTALMTYLLDGRIPIDNTDTERTIRPFTIGRNNWLFFGSERGGRRGGKIFTVLHSAHRHCLDEMAYLHDVLFTLATQPVTEELLDSLLPDVWAKSHAEHVRSFRLREREQKQTAQRARREEDRNWRLTDGGVWIPA